MTNEQKAIYEAQKIVRSMVNNKWVDQTFTLDCRLTEAARDYIIASGYDVEQTAINTVNGVLPRDYRVTFNTEK